jgi:hypothetical protein
LKFAEADEFGSENEAFSCFVLKFRERDRLFAVGLIRERRPTEASVIASKANNPRFGAGALPGRQTISQRWIASLRSQ